MSCRRQMTIFFYGSRKVCKKARNENDYRDDKEGVTKTKNGAALMIALSWILLLEMIMMAGITAHDVSETAIKFGDESSQHWYSRHLRHFEEHNINDMDIVWLSHLVCRWRNTKRVSETYFASSFYHFSPAFTMKFINARLTRSWHWKCVFITLFIWIYSAVIFTSEAEARVKPFTAFACRFRSHVSSMKSEMNEWKSTEISILSGRKNKTSEPSRSEIRKAFNLDCL